jgi:hypothetical protein
MLDKGFGQREHNKNTKFLSAHISFRDFLPTKRRPPLGLSPSRRRLCSDDTARAAAQNACRKHLKDLRRAHSQPPRELAIPRRSIPGRIDPEPVASWCPSPAQLCAELAE